LGGGRSGPPIEEPEQQSSQQAEQQAGDPGDVKGGVLAAPDDVAGEAAKRQIEPIDDHHEQAERDEYDTAKDEKATELHAYFDRNAGAEPQSVRYTGAEREPI